MEALALCRFRRSCAVCFEGVYDWMHIEIQPPHDDWQDLPSIVALKDGFWIPRGLLASQLLWLFRRRYPTVVWHDRAIVSDEIPLGAVMQWTSRCYFEIHSDGPMAAENRLPPNQSGSRV